MGSRWLVERRYRWQARAESEPPRVLQVTALLSGTGEGMIPSSSRGLIEDLKIDHLLEFLAVEPVPFELSNDL